MDAYDLYVTLHVAGAVLWVGGNSMIAILSARKLKRNRPEELESLLSDLTYMTPRYFIPVSLLTVAFGVVSVWKGPFEFSDPWVGAGLTMFIVSFLIGVGYLGPQAEKMDELAQAGGSASDEWNDRLHRFLIASNIELALLWLTVIVMVVKPG